jgi:hydroxypyruvate isomerase
VKDKFSGIDRRSAFGAIVGAAAGLAVTTLDDAAQPVPSGKDRPPLHGRLKQSVCHWIVRAMPFAEVCVRAKEIGFTAIDLLYPDEWPMVRDAGLECSLAYASRRERFIEIGFNDPMNHSMLIKELEKAVPLAAREGIPGIIAMFGNRTDASDAEAVAHCVTGLSKIAPLAEQYGVTICVELLNSKVDHPHYQGDHTAFGVAVMQGVNSPRVKLLHDIYHMQIMEGDVIQGIRNHIQWIGHFHTGGVPGRHEIDASQELNYRAIANAIADLGFQGYVAHEFIPTRDPFQSLAEAYQICRV